MLKVNQKVVVKNNLYDELVRLGVSKYSARSLHDEFVGTKQNIYHIWRDDEDENQYWATIELSVEIPIQCLGEIE